MSKPVKNSKTTGPRTPRTFEEIYNNMCLLKRDLYYKSIVHAHKDVLIRKTTEQIEDIFHRYDKGYISKFTLFTEMEGMICRNSVIDTVIYEKIMHAKKIYRKPKFGSKGKPNKSHRPKFNNKTSSSSKK